ncbi:hypothetical protein NKH77_33280 [Streptomyces sp. M19]
MAVSSGLLSGKPALVQHIEPGDGWKEATVKVTDTVADPVTNDLTAGPGGTTYALSGGLAQLLAGKPSDGFTLTPSRPVDPEAVPRSTRGRRSHGPSGANSPPARGPGASAARQVLRGRSAGWLRAGRGRCHPVPRRPR